MDLRANIDSEITLKPMERVLVPTGLHLSIPEGYEAQIRARSGLALKHGVTVLNAPGTIDSDFTGNVSIIIANLGTDIFTISPGDRIAQMVFAKYEKVEFNVVEKLKKTERGEEGFGHTGV